MQPARPHSHADGDGYASPALGNPSGVQRFRREFRGCRSFLTTPPATHGKPLRGSIRGLTFILNAAMGWKTQRRKGAESAEEWGESPLLHRRTQQVNIFRSAMAP